MDDFHVLVLLIAGAFVFTFVVTMGFRLQSRTKWIRVMKALEPMLNRTLQVDSLLNPLGKIHISGIYQDRCVRAECEIVGGRNQDNGRKISFFVPLASGVPREPLVTLSREVVASSTFRRGGELWRILPGTRSVYPFATPEFRFGTRFFERELRDMVQLANEYEEQHGIRSMGRTDSESR